MERANTSILTRELVEIAKTRGKKRKRIEEALSKLAFDTHISCPRTYGWTRLLLALESRLQKSESANDRDVLRKFRKTVISIVYPFAKKAANLNDEFFEIP